MKPYLCIYIYIYIYIFRREPTPSALLNFVECPGMHIPTTGCFRLATVMLKPYSSLLNTQLQIQYMILATGFCFDVWIEFWKKQKITIFVVLQNIQVSCQYRWKRHWGTPFWGPRVVEPSVPKPVGWNRRWISMDFRGPSWKGWKWRNDDLAPFQKKHLQIVGFWCAIL